MPQRIEDSLLIVERFKSDGVEYQPGDRVPVRHRAIRRIAAQNPQFFRMEFETAELDLEWLAGIEAGSEARYEAVKRHRAGEKDRQERALRDELKEQNRSQPDLERRFEKQEADKRRREKEAQEELAAGDPAGNRVLESVLAIGIPQLKERLRCRPRGT
jgi:hypothetical protein